MLARQAAAADAQPPGLFAMIDVAQINGLDRKWPRAVDSAAHRLLFENTLAQSALALSPVVLALSPDAQEAARQWLALDQACASHPVLSVIMAACHLDELTEHLQSLLRIEADGEDFLWRFADTQMMRASVGVFRQAQRPRVFGPCQGWWVVDHQGQLINLAQGHLPQQGGGDPLVLDDIDTGLLIDAVTGPMLASQMRAMELDFANTLSHAQQTAFVEDCLQRAADADIDRERELLAWSLQQWQDSRPNI
jgi:hypothetical protein